MAVIAAVLYAALPAVLLGLSSRSGARDAEFRAARCPIRIRPYVPAALLLARYPETSLFSHRMRAAEALIRGEREARERAWLRLAEMLASFHQISAAGAALGAALSDPAPAIAALLPAVLVPCWQYRTVLRQVERRKRLILLELPLVINRLILFLQSGETLMRALEAASRAPDREGHPLHEELRGLLTHWQHHQSFAAAAERFARRCAVHEASVFANALLMNYRRGGDDLIHALRILAAELWSRRKALARTLGEEASSKLVFPMVLIFFTVTVIVAAPAFYHLG